MKLSKAAKVSVIALVALFLAGATKVASIYIIKAASHPQDFSSVISKYSRENKRLKEVETKQADAIFMGNSITEMWSEIHADFMPSHNYINRGIGGQTTPQMLLRFREDVIDLKPKIVVIEGGINDIAENTGKYNADFTLGNIKSMAEIARANGIKVIIASVLPATQIPWDDSITNVRQKVADLNKNIQEYANKNGFEYMDYFSALVGENGNLKTEYRIDDIHINGKAYTVLEPLIMAKIDALLNQ